jgi:subtilisin family serine protease
MSTQSSFLSSIGQVIALASLSAVACSASAQPVSDNFAMGKQVTRLARSELFESVVFVEESPPGGMRSLVSPSKAVFALPPGIGRALVLPDLDSKGILLVELAPGATANDLLSEVRAFNLRPQPPGSPRRVAVAGGEQAGYPIYSAGSVHYLVTDEVLVRFQRGTDVRTIEALLGSRGATIVETPTDPDRDSYLIRFPGMSGHEVREQSNKLDAHGSVEYSQPNFTYIDPHRLPRGGLASGRSCVELCPTAVSSPSASDKFLGNQWHLAKVNAFRAWQFTAGNPDVAIAILDDLVDDTHLDLLGKIIGSWNAVSPSSLSLFSIDEHGTSAAGLAVAVQGNGIGVAGVAPRVSLFRIRTHQPNSNTNLVVKGIRHTFNFPRVRVLSMSWTLGDESLLVNGTPAVDLAIEDAILAGKVLVFANGNSYGLTAMPAEYPANRAEGKAVIAVSATDAWDNLQKKTSAADTCGWNSNVSEYSVAAPGFELHTIDRPSTEGYCTTGPDSDYARFGGTSAATPLVAGIAALMISKDPGLTPQQVKELIYETAEHPNPQQRPNDAGGWGLGWGRVDACRALGGGESCSRGGTPSPPIDLIIQ